LVEADVSNRIPESTRCTAVRSTGRFCDQPSLPGAPFPICVKHAARIMAFLNDVTPRTVGHQVVVAAEAIRQNRAVVAERHRRAPDVYVVYYLQVGDAIKIGYTANLPTRLRTYPPNAKLLAYESGGQRLEARRHRQFAEDLAAGREWFRPSERLLAHIDSIKAARAA
jgi:hypothetical protein